VHRTTPKPAEESILNVPYLSAIRVSNSDMLEPEDVAGAVLLACKQSPGSRIIEIQMRTMAESLA